MTEATKTQVWKAAGMGAVSIAAGMAVYQTYPTSISQAIEWMWQPFWQSVIQAGAAFGVYRNGAGAPTPPSSVKGSS